jgi:ferredoxin
VSTSVEIRFIPGPFIAEVEPGSTLLAAARKARAPLEAPCDGAGICGKCLVWLDPEALTALEPGVDVRGGNAQAALVLACDARVPVLRQPSLSAAIRTWPLWTMGWPRRGRWRRTLRWCAPPMGARCGQDKK